MSHITHLWSRHELGAKALFAAEQLINAEASLRLGEYAVAGTLAEEAVEAAEALLWRARRVRSLARASEAGARAEGREEPNAPGEMTAAAEEEAETALRKEEQGQVSAEAAQKGKGKHRPVRRGGKKNKRRPAASEEVSLVQDTGGGGSDTSSLETAATASGVEAPAAAAPAPAAELASAEAAEVERWRDRRARNRWEILGGNGEEDQEPEAASVGRSQGALGAEAAPAVVRSPSSVAPRPTAAAEAPTAARARKPSTPAAGAAAGAAASVGSGMPRRREAPAHGPAQRAREAPRTAEAAAAAAAPAGAAGASAAAGAAEGSAGEGEEAEAEAPRREVDVGSTLQVLPGEEMVIDGVEYYKSGDFGTVQKFYEDSRQQQTRFSIQWHRSGKTSTVSKASWDRWLRLVDSAEQGRGRGASLERSCEGGAPLRSSASQLQTKRVSGKLVEAERSKGSGTTIIRYYEAYERDWLMLGHSVRGDMVLLKEGPLVRRAMRWRHVWLEKDDGEGGGHGVYLPEPDHPDYVACGTVFVSDDQNLNEPRADVPVALVHRSLVEPVTPEVDLWSFRSDGAQQSLLLKLIPTLNTAWPGAATLLQEPPRAYALKQCSSQRLPTAGTMSLSLCVRNTFLDFRTGVDPTSGALPRRAHSWPQSPEREADPWSEELEEKADFVQDVEPSFYLGDAADMQSEEGSHQAAGPQPAAAPAAAPPAPAAPAAAPRPLPAGPLPVGRVVAAAAEGGGGGARSPFSALLPLLGPGEERSLRAACRATLRWTRPLPRPAALPQQPGPAWPLAVPLLGIGGWREEWRQAVCAAPGIWCDRGHATAQLGRSARAAERRDPNRACSTAARPPRHRNHAAALQRSRSRPVLACRYAPPFAQGRGRPSSVRFGQP